MRVNSIFVLVLIVPFYLLVSNEASAESKIGYAVGDKFSYVDRFKVQGYGTELVVDSEIKISVKKMDENEIIFTRTESGTISWPRGGMGTIQFLDSHGGQISSIRSDSFNVKNEISYSECNREFIMGEGVHTVKAFINVQSGQFRNTLWGSLPQYHPLEDNGLLNLIIDPILFSNEELEIEDKIFVVRGPESVNVPAGTISSYILARDGENRWYDSTTGLLVKKQVRSHLGSEILELIEVEYGSERQNVCATVIPEFDHFLTVITLATLVFVIATRFKINLSKHFSIRGCARKSM